MNYNNYNLRGLKVFFLTLFCWIDIIGSERRSRNEKAEDRKGLFQQQLEKQLTIKPYQMKQLTYILIASLFQIVITIALTILYSIVMKNFPEVSNIAIGLAFIAIWVTEFAVLLGVVFKSPK